MTSVFLGSICRVNLTYETEQDLLPPNFILKMPAEGEEALATGNQTGAYSTEANFFQHLANQGIEGARKRLKNVLLQRVLSLGRTAKGNRD